MYVMLVVETKSSGDPTRPPPKLMSDEEDQCTTQLDITPSIGVAAWTLMTRCSTRTNKQKEM